MLKYFSAAVLAAYVRACTCLPHMQGTAVPMILSAGATESHGGMIVHLPGSENTPVLMTT